MLSGTRPLACLAFLSNCFFGRGFYLPGVAPQEYPEGSAVDLKVNAMTSVKTQLPYGYYSMNVFCEPKLIKQRVENLGEILGGDVIKNSPYELLMKTNETCKVLCKRKLTKVRRNILRRRIDRDYWVNWIVDNLPAQTKYIRTEADGRQEVVFMNGFPVGALDKGKYFLHNHVRITLLYHSNAADYVGYRIVGFEVEPRSMNPLVRSDGDGAYSADCTDSGGKFDIDEHEEVFFTYDVVWVYSDIRWASRWDHYLQMEGGQIHWLSILNSAVIVLFLSGIVALILLRTLHRDIVKYNELATTEEMKEETGWKLVHGDVFRKPRYSKALVASLGSGVQLLGMAVVMLTFAALGFLSPAHRGGLLQSTLLLFTFMGIPGGYASARVFKLFGSEDWKMATLLTSMLYPGITFGIFFFLNLLIWGQASAGAVPFVTMFALLVLWFGISVPLVFLGAYLGYRQPAIELPVRTNSMPREIPHQPWYMQPVMTALVGGILPFGAVFTELFFIMSSIWQHQLYYMFGFLVLVLIILIITCAEISICLTYFQLTAEDYNWWWRSFITSGASGIYMMLYSWLYFNTRLNIKKTISAMLYFGYMSIFSGAFALVTGSIGTISTFFFIKAIYGSIKVD
jgi:transmembrane 9 superfamily protein 2/4|mmetsp:Transcript_1809/g.3115  ORF Transcript_1809/g.3115 Transcript_1809/m.3115 type:complete len:626 (+) Transcript_1809:67-1944(+)